MKVVVYHELYGCDTGCCGHAITVDDERENFSFSHPVLTSTSPKWPAEDPRTWAEALVRLELGNEHVKDLDWDNCLVVDD